MPEKIDFDGKNLYSAFGDVRFDSGKGMRQKVKEIGEQMFPSGEDLSQMEDKDLISRYQWLQRECEKAISSRNSLKDEEIKEPRFRPIINPANALNNILEAGKLGRSDMEEAESLKIVLIFSLLGYFQHEIDRRKLQLPNMAELER